MLSAITFSGNPIFADQTVSLEPFTAILAADGMARWAVAKMFRSLSRKRPYDPYSKGVLLSHEGPAEISYYRKTHWYNLVHWYHRASLELPSWAHLSTAVDNAIPHFEPFRPNPESYAALGILCAIHQGRPSRTLFINEPETHLHPRTQAPVAEELYQMSQCGFGQFIVTTNSHIFTDFCDYSVYRVAEKHDGKIVIGTLAPSQKHALDESLLSAADLFDTDLARIKDKESDDV